MASLRDAIGKEGNQCNVESIKDLQRFETAAPTICSNTCYVGKSICSICVLNNFLHEYFKLYYSRKKKRKKKRISNLNFFTVLCLNKINLYPVCQMVLQAYQLPCHFAMVTSFSPRRKEMM